MNKMRNILTLLLIAAMGIVAHAEELSIFNYIKVDQPAAHQQQVMKQSREISIYDNFKPEMLTIPAEAPSSVSLNATNSIWINNFDAIPFTRKTLNIYVSHDVTIQALQFTIDLPAGMTFATNNNGVLSYTLDSFYGSETNYSLSNYKRRLVVNFSGTTPTGVRTFAAHSGLFMQVDVEISDTYETSTLSMTNMQFTGFPTKIISVADRSVLAAADKGSSKVFIENFNILPGEVKDVPVMISHNEPMGAFQFDLEIPDGYRLVAGSDGYPYFKMNSTYNNGYSGSSFLNGGRFVVTAPISGTYDYWPATTKHEVMTIRIAASDNARAGKQDTLRVVEQVLSGQTHPSMRPEAQLTTITQEEMPYMYINNFTINPGETKTVAVKCKHNMAITGAQLDIEMPEGLSIKADAQGDPGFTVDSHYSGAGIKQSGFKSNGDALIFFVTNNTWNASAAQGDLLTIQVVADDSFTGPGTVKIKNSLFTGNGSNGQSIAYYLQDTTCVATVPVLGKVYIENFSIKPGETKTIPVMISHEVPVYMIRTDITMPEGLRIISRDDGSGKPGYHLKDPYLDNARDNSVFYSTDYARFTVDRSSSNPFPANAGTLMTIEVAADETFNGTQTIKIENGMRGLQGNIHTTDTTCTVTREYDVVLNVKTNNITFTPGETNNAIVYYASTEPTRAMTFEMTLPRGLDFVKKDNGSYSYSINPIFSSSLRALVSAVDSRARTVKVAIVPISSGRTIPAYDGSKPIFAIGITNTANFFQGTGNMSNVQYVNLDGVTINVPNSTFRIALAEEQLSIDVPEFKIVKGSMMQIVPKSSYGTQPTFTFTSSNEGVATVNERGFITAVGAGTATITATANDKSVTCNVTVVTFEDQNGDNNTDVQDINFILRHILNY